MPCIALAVLPRTGDADPDDQSQPCAGLLGLEVAPARASSIVPLIVDDAGNVVPVSTLGRDRGPRSPSSPHIGDRNRMAIIWRARWTSCGARSSRASPARAGLGGAATREGNGHE